MQKKEQTAAFFTLRKERPDAKHKKSHRGRRSAEALLRRNLRRDELHHTKLLEKQTSLELLAKQKGSDVSPPGGNFGQAKFSPPVFEDTNFTLLP